MDKRKLNILRRYGLFPAILCLCFCVVLGVGISYARYQSDFLTTSFWFTSSITDAVRMHGEVTDEDIEQIRSGIWPETPAAWSYSGSKAELRFSMSNGESAEQYATRNQCVSVELIASLSIEDPEKLAVTLTVTGMDGERVQYVGAAQQLTEGSRYYSTYGDGWVYLFYDEEGEEVTLLLEGGELRYTNCVLTVVGNTGSSLLSLEMSGKYTE